MRKHNNNNNNDFAQAFWGTLCILRDYGIVIYGGLLIWHMLPEQTREAYAWFFDVDENDYYAPVILLLGCADIFWHIALKHELRNWLESRRVAKLAQREVQRQKMEQQAQIAREQEAKQAYLIQGARTYVTANNITLLSQERLNAYLSMMRATGAKCYPTTEWQQSVIVLLSEEQRNAPNVQFFCLEWMRAQMAVVLVVYAINHGDHLEIQ